MTYPLYIETWDVMDLLSSLVDKSLVVYDETTGRYRLLETVRQYAQEKQAERGEEDTARGRHGRYFIDLAETVPGNDEVTQLNAIEAEYDNLRAALDWAETAGDGLDLKLTGALSRFWLYRCHWREGYDRLRRALSRSPDGAASPERARALYYAGTLAGFLHDHDAASEFMERALQTQRELGDQDGALDCLIGLGGGAYQRGDYETARTIYREALAVATEMGDDLKGARAINNIGIMDLEVGRYAEARDAFERVLPVVRSLNHRSLLANVSNNLGFILIVQGEHDEGGALLREALEINRRVGNRAWQSGNHYGLCLLELERGDTAQAWDHLKTSLRIIVEIESYSAGTEPLCLFARLAAARCEAALAARYAAAYDTEQGRLGTATPVWEREAVDRVSAGIRTELGEDAFRAAWVKGAVMTMSQAVDRALIEGEALFP